MSDRLHAHDWSASPLGALSTWPQSLRTAVDIMLLSRQPMFIAWGPQLVFLYNDAYAPILSTKHPDAFGEPFHIVWQDIWDDIYPMIERAMNGQASWLENFPLVMERSGFREETWFTFSYSPIRDESEAIAGLFCSCIETTLQVLAERRSTAERERLFEMTRDLFGVATFDGYLKSVNPAWSRILGRTEDYLLATPFAEFIHPDDLATTGDVVARLQDGKAVHQFHVRLLKADGEAVSFAWSAVPDMTPGSGLFYTVGRDITEELQRELTLRQSQKMEALGQLTGGLAHDFNNLLQAVQGNLDLIRSRPQDAERVARLANNGLQATARGTKLTAQLLAFSRAQKMELKATAVGPLIVGMDDILQRSLGPSVRVKLDLGGDNLGVLVDPTQLEMALLNLAINARDAMPNGGDLVFKTSAKTILRDPTLPPGHYVEIRVSDSGPGMSPAVAAQAFDPFFTTKGIGQGTGLGLSQVYAIAKQAGGVARIENLAPHGCAIILLLKSVTPEAIVASADTPGHSTPAGEALTVLVIDDDQDVRQFLADSLETMGFNVVLAEDGERGLAALDPIVPDLLLLDFAMPGMNGAQVADRVRALHPDLPIIFATGYSETAAIEAAVGESAMILRKPFGVADLQAALRTVLPDN